MAGLGVGCVSRLALAEEFRHKSLVPCRVPQRDFRRYFYFAVHQKKYHGGAIRAWLELCQSHAD
jgi:DNA-binding transcriptional LysR family regulator